MKSSSNAAAVRTGVVEGVVFSRWALADLRVEVPGEEAHDAVAEAARAAADEAEARARAAEAAAAEAERLEREAAEQERLAAEEQERRVREAYESGFEEGRQEGEIAEGARLRFAVRAAEEALDEIRAGEMRWTGTIEENICALAVTIARHVLGRELKGEVGTVMELVRGALAEFPIDQPIRIRLNPQDLNAVRQANDGEGPTDPMLRDREARWIADSQVAPGGCLVEGRERIVDGRVDTALERIYRRLTYTNA